MDKTHNAFGGTREALFRRFQHRLIPLLAVAAWSIAHQPQIFPLPNNLHVLALGAKSRRGWAPLRRYAKDTRNENAQGLAYFVLGYREYEARLFEPAYSDLHRAVETKCSLADFAEYYEALAAQQVNLRAQSIDLLKDFLARYSQSPFRQQATTNLANLLVGAGHASQAVQLLEALPGSQQRPDSLLALAKAYQAEANLPQAAMLYQRIYYTWPVSPAAQDAETALNELRARMGASYARASDKKETARAERIFESAQYGRAIEAYAALLKARPRSPMADEWTLGRARCLLRLGHYDAAAESLLNPMRANAAMDAARLQLLAHIYERADDEPSLLNVLNQLYQEYARSPHYADALYFAGDYFSRHGFWRTAGPYYQRLAQNFPESRWATQAAWWVAWYRVLDGQKDAAVSALSSYIRNYPESSHVPAALYWLGRIRESQGLRIQARGFYRAVESRFRNSYYGTKAREELRTHFRRDRVSGDSGAAAPPAILADLRINFPSFPEPSPDLLGREPTLPFLHPATTLAQLGLLNLVDGMLPQAVEAEPGNPALFFALARFRSEQDEATLALFAAREAVPNYQDYSFGELPREEWDLLYPRPYWKIVRAYARREGLSPYLMMGLIRQESAFDPRATSVADARGLMQIRPGTAAGRIRSRWRRRRIARLLYSPGYNIRVSSRYLRDLFREFGDDTGEALAAYNAGDFRAKEWRDNGKFHDSAEFVESIPFAETRVYVESVIRDAAIYHSLLTGTARFTRSSFN